MSVARGALWNLAGQLAPLVVALAALPVLVAHLDADRFGFFSLAWVIVGYFSLFDLGLGRALARLVAERLGTPRESELPALARTALALTFALGAFASALLLLFAAALRGILEAGRRFGWVNAVRVPLGILIFAGPALLALYTPNLIALAALLAPLRIAEPAAHSILCTKLYPRLTAAGALSAAGLAEMLRFGAWLTVTNVVGPFLVYLDRFVIGAIIARLGRRLLLGALRGGDAAGADSDRTHGRAVSRVRRDAGGRPRPHRAPLSRRHQGGAAGDFPARFRRGAVRAGVDGALARRGLRRPRRGAAMSETIRSAPAPRCAVCGAPGAPLYAGLRDRLLAAPGE